MEIDEYRDYEKALGALNEAVKQLTKAGPAGDKLTQLTKRVFLVERCDGLNSKKKHTHTHTHTQTGLVTGQVRANSWGISPVPTRTQCVRL